MQSSPHTPVTVAAQQDLLLAWGVLPWLRAVGPRVGETIALCVMGCGGEPPAWGLQKEPPGQETNTPKS